MTRDQEKQALRASIRQLAAGLKKTAGKRS